jgi:thiol:disulfide interchange protein/DsbC/DsbD-like thiol-disulfide interchange protein
MMNFRILLTCISLMAGLLWAEPVRDKHVAAELIAETTHVQPGQPFWLAIKLTMDPHWHTYWRNPGDSGLGTTVDWELPEGYAADPLIWPHPERIASGPLVSYGYENEVALLALITPPAAETATSLAIRAKAAWLMCEEVCIPGNATLALTIPVRDAAPSADARWTALFANHRAQVPASEVGWTARADVTDKEVVLTLTPGTPSQRGAWSAEFFPYADDVIDHAAEQRLMAVGNSFELRMPRSTLSKTNPATLNGILVRKDGWREDGSTPAWEISAAVGAPTTTAPTAAPATPTRSMSFPLALLFAFAGGLILNLMPCVFPVISIKILGFVEQAGESRARLFSHGLVFSLGVLVCFWGLAGTLMALRASGSEIGWGFQLQQPVVVIVLAAVFFVLGLSLFGIFEIGLSLTSAGAGVQSKSGYIGSFFSGLLATVVATPCTAPFMGAALGYALALPTFSALLIFTMLGLGMALPYLVLSASPGLIQRIPRPGPWMETLKQFMGFLMMATVVWLAWVLSLQSGSGAIIALMGGFVGLGMAAWILGRWAALHRAPGTRWVARFLALTLAIVSMRPATQAAREGRSEGADAAVVTEGGVTWEVWSPERVTELRAAGKTVFVDFTAAWCLTCQVNKRVALHQREVEAAFLEKGVVTLKADWTDRNETIARALSDFGRSGVPLYVLYGSAAEPVLLPEVLTPGVVLEALNQLQ